MKFLRYLKTVIFICLFYLIFAVSGCTDAHDADHDHDHEHSESTEAHDETDHDHDHEAEQSDEADHDHDDHDHESGQDEEEGHSDESTEQTDPDIIELDEKTKEIIGLKTSPVKFADFDEVIKATGKVINNQDNEAHISSLVSGRVSFLLADLGESVRKGQKLVSVESIEIGKKRADYQKAKAELELASAEFSRKENLYKQAAISERDYLESETRMKTTKINLDYTEKMLLLSGLEKEELNSSNTGHDAMESCSFYLTSSINGVVIERNALKGEEVEPGSCLYKILDISSVWIEIDVFEKDLQNVRTGGKVKLRVPAYPDMVFTGNVFYIGHTLDESTRTIKVRVEVRNEDMKLKPGMFADVDFVIGERKDVLSIPEEALLSEGDIFYVFAEHDGHFHRSSVTIGNRGDGLVEIISGLSAGIEVVVRGNYQLKSKMLMSGVDPHAGHNH